jgi:uncharacterized membrane protein YvbJ
MMGDFMTLTCENCGQMILPTDTVCWHCGKELELRQDTQRSESVTAKESDSISITAVSIFTLITLITILLFIIVTNALAG